MKWMSFVVLAMSVAGGCATGPPAPVSTQTPPAVAATSTAAPRTAAPADPSVKQVNRALIAQGYQPSIYRGQLYYCRKQKLTGSQFTQRVCLTEQEAALQERIAQDEMNKRNSVGKCVPPLCPNH
jgi:hypothetical protein